jgi:mevalonate kinase
MPAISARAPAKTILFGEHAVVYGYAAIAVPIRSIGMHVSVHARPDEKSGHLTIFYSDSQIAVNYSKLPAQNPTRAALQTIFDNLAIPHPPAMEIRISSTIPTAAGLGSSAAFAVSLTRAVSHFLGFSLDTGKINEIAFQIEKHIHGTPSGIDNTVIAYDQPLFFQKEKPHEFLEIRKPIHLVIADSGVRMLTKKVVDEVREKKARDQTAVDEIFKEIHIIVGEAKQMLLDGDMPSLGRLMNRNHQLLADLGVSCPELDHLVQAALRAGALGAKMCGGGQGGIITALVNVQEVSKVIQSLSEAGASACINAELGKGQR